MLEFSFWHHVFYGFYRGEQRSDWTLIEWERDADVLVGISSLFILVEKSIAKLGALEAATRGDTENNTWGMKLKVFSFELCNF